MPVFTGLTSFAFNQFLIRHPLVRENPAFYHIPFSRGFASSPRKRGSRLFVFNH